VASLMTSSEKPASQSSDKTMSLIAQLYAKRDKFPMQAEPQESEMIESQDK
jgi:hypothetical protein